MTVTVVVPTFNRSQYVACCLRSLLNQTRPPDRVLVIDDGSTDSTEAVVRDIAGVEYVYQSNGGKSAALNHALSLVNTEYVWFFDDDDVAMPNAVERLVAALDGSKCMFAYGTLCEHEDAPDGLGPCLGEVQMPPLAATSPFVALLENCYIGGARVFARTEAYRQIGGFDERFRRSQDYLVALKLMRRWPGAQVGGGPLYKFRIHTGVRGAAEFSIDSAEAWRSHLRYDAAIMRDVTGTLGPEDYLGDLTLTDHTCRLSQLEKLSVLLRHRVYPEYLEVLEELARMTQGPRYTKREVATLERLVADTNGLALGGRAFSADLVSRLSASEIRRLRRTLLRLSLLSALTSQSGVSATARRLWRASWLTSPGLRVNTFRRGD